MEVHAACLPYWEGFIVLSKSRPWNSAGMAGLMPGYIPYTHMAAYAKDHFYTDVEELDLFVYLVQSLDDVFVEHMRKVAAAKNPKK